MQNEVIGDGKLKSKNVSLFLHKIHWNRYIFGASFDSNLIRSKMKQGSLLCTLWGKFVHIWKGIELLLNENIFIFQFIFPCNFMKTYFYLKCNDSTMHYMSVLWWILENSILHWCGRIMQCLQSLFQLSWMTVYLHDNSGFKAVYHQA